MDENRTESGSPDLLVEQRGRILLLTLNRPHDRNAVSRDMSLRIAEAVDRLDSDPELSVAVITGAGDTFAEGMDLEGFARGELPGVEGLGFAGLVRRPPQKPLIAAVEGYALAGGFEIVLTCDLVVASRTAQFGLPEVAEGRTAAAGGLLRLPRRIPHNLAMELVLTGRKWDAADAAEQGLVNRLAEPGAALDAALELAAEIAANAPLALVASKQVMMRAGDWPTEDGFERQQEYVQPANNSMDAKEGARAVAEKRAPHWTGR